MKAIRVHKNGDAEVLKIEDIPKPTPKAHQAIIRVKAAGLNFIDIYMRKGDPIIPTPRKLYVAILIFVFCLSPLAASEKTREERLKEESQNILERSFRIAAQFYSLEDGEECTEITDSILQSNETKDSIKQTIRTSGRRFFLFKYPSGGFRVKGYISFVPNALENPLMIFLRGGTGIFGLTHPATDFTCVRNYTVIGTSYRGGVSEGSDEFGGNEVDDVHNLMEYFPALQEKLKIQFVTKKILLLGASRGGMEMFLAMSRSPTLQYQVTKAASLSGLFDMRECMIDREDMRRMFIRDFGFIPGQNEEEWIHDRDPLASVPNLRKDLPILILQGTDDLRSSLNQGYHMVKRLEDNGNPVTYLEIQGGNHCLGNQSNRMDIIANWFEN